MFWYRSTCATARLVDAWPEAGEVTRWSASASFLVMIAVSIAGNFFARLAGAHDRLPAGDRGASALGWTSWRCSATFVVPAKHQRARVLLVPAASGFFSGVFALFTMYLPPLFPTLLRTTGAGFCYNIGRTAAAVGTVVFGLLAPVNDYREALLWAGALALLAAGWSLRLPEDGDSVIR